MAESKKKGKPKNKNVRVRIAPAPAEIKEPLVEEPIAAYAEGELTGREIINWYKENGDRIIYCYICTMFCCVRGRRDLPGTFGDPSQRLCFPICNRDRCQDGILTRDHAATLKYNFGLSPEVAASILPHPLLRSAVKMVDRRSTREANERAICFYAIIVLAVISTVLIAAIPAQKHCHNIEPLFDTCTYYPVESTNRTISVPRTRCSTCERVVTYGIDVRCKKCPSKYERCNSDCGGFTACTDCTIQATQVIKYDCDCKTTYNSKTVTDGFKNITVSSSNSKSKSKSVIHVSTKMTCGDQECRDIIQFSGNRSCYIYDIDTLPAGTALPAALWHAVEIIETCSITAAGLAAWILIPVTLAASCICCCGINCYDSSVPMSHIIDYAEYIKSDFSASDINMPDGVSGIMTEYANYYIGDDAFKI